MPIHYSIEHEKLYLKTGKFSKKKELVCQFCREDHAEITIKTKEDPPLVSKICIRCYNEQSTDDLIGLDGN